MARAKGTIVAEVVKFLRRNREAACARLPEALHHYLSERLLPSSWYPEEDLLRLLHVMVEFMPGSGSSVWRRIGHQTVELHASGSYENILGGREGADMADRSSALRRIQVLWRSQHDTGQVVVTEQDAARCRVDLRDYALPSAEMCAIVTGYIERAIELMGVGDATVEKRECCTSGAACCSWEVRWSKEAG